MQDNEPTSLRRMTSHVEEVASKATAEEWKEARQLLLTFLDSETNISIEEGRQLTHSDVLELFVWGDRAHGKPAKRAVFKDLAETPMFPILQVDFVRVLWAFGSTVRELRRLVLAVLHDREAG